MLVGLPLVLGGALVIALVQIVGATDLRNPLDCPPADHRLADDLGRDAAVEQLRAAFPGTPEAGTGCDEDDRTVSADLEVRTGLPRAQALRIGEQALRDNAWQDAGSCFVKEVDGRQVWATVIYRDEYRRDQESDVMLSMASVRDAAC